MPDPLVPLLRAEPVNADVSPGLARFASMRPTMRTRLFTLFCASGGTPSSSTDVPGLMSGPPDPPAPFAPMPPDSTVTSASTYAAAPFVP